MREIRHTLFSAGDMSGDLYSTKVPIRQGYGWAAQLFFTGAPVGQLSFKVSCDPVYDDTDAILVPADARFTLYAGSQYDVTGPTSQVWNVNLAHYNWVMFFWDVTSGTGTLDGELVMKVYLYG